MRHLRVLRPRDGEEVELFDGRFLTRLYRWSQREGALIAAGEARKHASPAADITLFACVTKGQRWDWTLQKATELGATRIVPVLSARTIVRIASGEAAAKAARWQKIAEEAARQSSAVFLPEILPPCDFAAALGLARETTCFVGALLSPPPQPLLSAFSQAAAKAAAAGATGEKPHYSLFVGPEGDFTPEEMAALLEFAIPTSFGPLVLRAETAAIFALSVLNAALSAPLSALSTVPSVSSSTKSSKTA